MIKFYPFQIFKAGTSVKRAALIIVAFFCLFTVQAQTVYSFSNCTATGKTGPTQTQVNAAYAVGNTLQSAVTSNIGKQEWVVPVTGSYSIKAAGAKGGGNGGGNGAVLSGEFMLTQGHIIQIVVGQRGTLGRGQLGSINSGGGGGGTYVVDKTSNTILIIAGGGGGGNGDYGSPYLNTAGNPGNYTTSGSSTYSTGGGINGNGGKFGVTDDPAAGGGGYLTSGENTGASGLFATGGSSFLLGSVGGNGRTGTYFGGDGGFGGGGGGTSNVLVRGGGGGGYSGGQGGTYQIVQTSIYTSTNDRGHGGGGGSINNGTNTVNYATNAGEGFVTTTLLIPQAKALNFDGVDDYVNIANPYRAFNKELSVEFWFNPANTSLPFGAILGQGTSNVDDMSNNIWLMHPNGNGTFTFYVNDAGTWRASTQVAIIPNSWHHYAGVVSATGIKIYVDGVQQGSTNAGISNTILNTSNSVIHLGKDVRFNTQRFGNISLDEVRVWSRALCESEILNNMNCELNPASQTGLQEYYQFNQGYVNTNNSAVTSLTDLSGNGRNGTLNSFALTGTVSNWVPGNVTGNCTVFTAPTSPITGAGLVNVGSTISLANATAGGTWTSSNSAIASINASGEVTGIANGSAIITYTTSCGGISTATITVVTAASALSFGATTDYVNLGSVLPSNASFTKEGWIYSTDASSLNNLFSTNGDPIYIPSGKINVGQGGNYGVVNDPDLFPMNQWVHVAITYDKSSTTLKLYVNGVLKGSNTNAPAFTGGLTYLGQHPGGGGQSSVKMDEVRFWNRAICQSELLSNMNCEMNPTGQNGLVALYHFNQGYINTTNSVTALIDASGNGNNGTLVGFTNSGSSSNWVAGSNISGNCTVFTAVAAPITGATLVCKGSTITLANANAGVFTSSNISVATISATGVVTGVAAGTATITFTSSCGAVSTTSITVDALPVATITAASATTICPSSSVTLNSNSGTGYTYQWLKDGANISDAISSTYNASTTGSYSVVITNSNGCISSVSNEIIVTVLDDIAPTFTSAQTDLTATATSANGAVVSYTLPTATDNCTINPTVTAVPASGSIFPIGTTLVTVTATDATGNSVNTAFNVVVAGVAPELVVPADFDVNTTVGACTAIVNFAVTETTGIPASTITYTEYGIPTYSGYMNDVGTHTITATATNAIGSTSKTFTFTVHDVTPPQFTSTATILTANVGGAVQATSLAGAVVNFTLPAATDNCANAYVTAVPYSGSVFPLGENTVVVTATDPSGNTSQTTFTVTVVGVAPSIVVPSTITVNNKAGLCNAIVNFAATDPTGVPASTITYDIQPGSVFNVGTTKVTATATNELGSSSLSFDVVVKDSELPKVFTKDPTIYLDANGQATLTVAQVDNGSTDNCAIANKTISKTLFNCSDLVKAVPNASALKFNGSGIAYIPSVIPGGNNFSFSSWFYANDAGNGKIISSGAFEICLCGNSIQVYTPNGGSFGAQGISLNRWHNIIVTYSFPLAKVYVDGILSFSFNAGPIGGISGAALGRHVNGCCPLIGTLDEMSFWNITLSASQIAAMQTKALKGDEAGLTAYYNFDEATGTTIIDRSGNHHNAIMQSMLNPWTTVAAPITTSASNTVILSVTDASGNIATGTAVVTVLDAIAPTITAPANMNVFATSASGATVTYTEPVGTDNCSVTTTRIAGLASGSVFPIGTTTVTYSAVDLSGNKTDCSFTVTVAGIAPSIVKPADISVASPLGECGANVNFAATESVGIPASVITYTVDGSEVVSGANFSVGVHTITATATNAIGSTSVDFTITVIDDQLPTITAPADITINNTEGHCGAINVRLGWPEVADNCSVVDYYPTYHSEFPVGTTDVEWTVVDASGNTATAIQHVTVIDNEKPFIRKAFDWGREGGTAEPGKCGTSNIASLHLGVPGTASTFTVSDNCEIASITSNAPTFFPVGVTIVTYTVTDIHGNFSTIDEEVTVSDFEPPVIAAVDNITVNATGAAGAVVNYTAPVGTDNCSAATTVMTAGLVSGSTFPIGTTVVTYTVTDATGLTASTSFNVTVIGIAPEIVAPNNYLVNSEAGKCGASVNFAATETRAIPASTITYTENGSAIVSGAYFTVGTHTITATATNAVGSSSVDFTITVVDHQAPIAKAKNITVGLGTQVGGLVTITAAQVDNGSTDACGIASMTVVPASFGCSKVGANTVTLTVTDVNGNSSTTTAVVTIVDDKGPVPTVTTLPTITGQCYATALTLKPGEHEEDHDGDDDNNRIEMDHYYLVVPTAMDNCSGLAKGTTTDPLTYYNQGTYIIHWKYVDAKGNVTIQEQTVIVKDTQAPTPKRATLPTITGQCSVIVNGSNDKDHDDDGDDDGESHHSNTPWAKDNCSGWIKGTTTDPLTYTVQGTYTITWSFNDGHGNVSTQTQTVIVKDVTKPRINAPKDKTISCGSNILPATTGMATATDNCTATPVITYTDVNTNNLITRTWTATDAAGNTSTDVQLIKLTPAFTAVAKSTATSTVYTGGSTTNIYLGYGAQSTTLSVSGLPAGNYTYTWTGSNLSNSNSATPVFTATTAGVTTFYVTVTNANGCSSTASISICVTDVRVPGSNGALIYVCHQGSSKSGGTQTLSIPVAQVAAHLANSCGSKGNDKLGSCSSTACTTNTENSAVDPKSGDAIEIQTLKTDVAATTVAEDIKVIVMPNPSTTYFTLKFETKDQKTPLSLRVMDASGRAIDSKQQIEPSNTIQIGHNYPSGTFFAEVIQGNKRKTVQLIKAKG